MNNSLLENYPKSIYIQKFSSTTYTPDCKDIVGEDLTSKFGLVNGINNIWRVKVSRASNWVYLKTFEEVFTYLNNELAK